MGGRENRSGKRCSPQPVTGEGAHGGSCITLHCAGERARWGFQPRAAAHAVLQRQPSEAHPVSLQRLGEHLAHACRRTGLRGGASGLTSSIGLATSVGASVHSPGSTCTCWCPSTCVGAPPSNSRKRLSWASSSSRTWRESQTP
jgi:hypothetical protein